MMFDGDGHRFECLAACVGRPAASGSRPCGDHPGLGLSGVADGGDAMNKTDTKSTVLLKHHLKAFDITLPC